MSETQEKQEIQHQQREDHHILQNAQRKRGIKNMDEKAMTKNTEILTLAQEIACYEQSWHENPISDKKNVNLRGLKRKTRL